MLKTKPNSKQVPDRVIQLVNKQNIEYSVDRNFFIVLLSFRVKKQFNSLLNLNLNNLPVVFSLGCVCVWFFL